MLFFCKVSYNLFLDYIFLSFRIMLVFFLIIGSVGQGVVYEVSVLLLEFNSWYLRVWLLDENEMIYYIYLCMKCFMQWGVFYQE